MKKFVYIAVLLTFINISTSAQKWQQTFGAPNAKEIVMDVIETYDGGYLLSGSYEENVYNWLIKTDINGNLLWDKKFIWSNNGYLYWGKLVQDTTGNIYLSCLFSKPGTGTWPLILKLNPCVELEWCRVFADYDFMFGGPIDMHIDDEDNIVLLTQFESEEQIDQVFIYYITNEGDYLWKKSIASSTIYPLIDSRVSERLNYYNERYIINGYCYYPNPGNPGVVYLRPFFVMLDHEFNELWVKPFGISDYIYGIAYNVIPLSDSTYMGVGTRRFVPSGGGLISNSLMMFFDNDGQELGYTQIPNEVIGSDIGSNFIKAIVPINDSLFMASANFGEEDQGNPFGELIVDTAGNVYGSGTKPNTNFVSSLIKTSDNKYAFALNWKKNVGDYDILFYKLNEFLEDDTINPNVIAYDSLCPNQILSETIDLTGSTIITDVSEYPTHDDFLKRQNKVSIKVVPNPAANGLVNILISNTERYNELELDVFNIFGQKVHHATLEKETESLLINTQEWPSGIYLVTLFNQNRSIGQAKMIIQ
ncbi:MAG TPA: T9SS type A sorting domain-containing protein [Bacteroidales bacterium]|nr:T9SS type A sorting domain-containing protein [Bacteroidales bacterium]